MENKPTLLLPNGLKVSVGDRTNLGIVFNFTADKIEFKGIDFYKFGCFFLEIINYNQITYVHHRYDWVNALGENDFAFELDRLFVVTDGPLIKEYNLLDTNQYIPSDKENTYFSRKSDAERYLTKIKEEDSLSLSTELFLRNNGISFCDTMGESIKILLKKFAEIAIKKQKALDVDELRNFGLPPEYLKKFINAKKLEIT